MQWWEALDAPILGRYRIERLLGEGGMARVFLATDVRANRPVAFKTPKLEEFPPAALKELLSRFNREFSAQASDPIQGVIPIYESGEFTDADGVVRPFLAMQYLSGGSLGDVLGGTIGQRAHRQTLAEVLEWLVPIARTLDRLHARKYLHRDVKPDNILFNSDGDPFLADLGIVGSLDNALGGSTMAATGLGVLGSPGSPGYQSPESIQADAAMRNVSASDQFSLAVTVYEALAGCLPVNAGTNQQWYGALMHWSPTPLSTYCPDMPSAASDAVMKAMSTQAAGRFTTCSEFAKALAESIAAARPAPRAVQASTPADELATLQPGRGAGARNAGPAFSGSRKRAWVWGGAVVAATLSVASAWLFLVPAPDGSSAVPHEPGPDAETAPPAVESPEHALAKRLAELCRAAGGTASSSARNGCQLPGKITDWSVQFQKGDAALGPEAMKVLDTIADAMSRESRRYGLSVVAHSEAPPSTDWRFDSLTTLRVVAVEEYLFSRGVVRMRLERFIPSKGETSPEKRGSVDLRLEPRLPMDSAANAWVICSSLAVSPGSRTASHAVSEPMEVMNVSDWFRRIKAERPDRALLQASGLSAPSPMLINCTPAAPTAEDAQALESGWIVEFTRSVVASGYTSLVKVPGRWHLRGTGRSPSGIHHEPPSAPIDKATEPKSSPNKDPTDQLAPPMANAEQAWKAHRRFMQILEWPDNPVLADERPSAERSWKWGGDPYQMRILTRDANRNDEMAKSHEFRINWREAKDVRVAQHPPSDDEYYNKLWLSHIKLQGKTRSWMFYSDSGRFQSATDAVSELIRSCTVPSA